MSGLRPTPHGSLSVTITSLSGFGCLYCDRPAVAERIVPGSGHSMIGVSVCRDHLAPTGMVIDGKPYEGESLFPEAA